MASALIRIFAVLILLALAAAHVRSYRVIDSFGIAMAAEPRAEMLSYRGRLIVAAHGSGYAIEPAVHRVRPIAHRATLPDRGKAMLAVLRDISVCHYEFAGIGYAKSHPFPGEPVCVFLYLPYWLLALVVSLPLLTTVYRRQRGTVRRSRGLCSTCGYDIRATPDRCPECGTATPVTAPSN